MSRYSSISELVVLTESTSEEWFPYIESENTLAILYRDSISWENLKVTVDLTTFSISEPQIIQGELPSIHNNQTSKRSDFAYHVFPSLDEAPYGSYPHFYGNGLNPSEFTAMFNDQLIASISEKTLYTPKGSNTNAIFRDQYGELKDQFGRFVGQFADNIAHFIEVDWGDSVSVVPYQSNRPIVYALDEDTVLITDQWYKKSMAIIVNKSDEIVSDLKANSDIQWGFSDGEAHSSFMCTLIMKGLPHGQHRPHATTARQITNN